MENKTEIKLYKTTSVSYATEPNAVFFVKSLNDSAVKTYITTIDGQAIPLKDLSGTGGVTNITSTDGSITITGLGTNKNIQVSSSLQTLINSALQSGDIISSLLNDAGYITLADVPVFNPSDYDLEDFTNNGADVFIRESDLGAVATSNDYNDLDNIPTEFPPSSHTHVEADITDLDKYTQSEVDSKLITKQNLPTGFISGLTLSINTDPTKIDIASGAYTISDFSDLENVTVQIIEVASPIIGVTPAYLNTNNISYVAIDENQNLVWSSSPFTNEQRRTLAILGAAIHSNLVNVNVVNEIKAPIIAPTNQLHDFMRAIGSFNLSGNIYGANGINLQLNKTAGTVFGLGINGHNHLNPHQLDIASQTALTFRYRLQNGFEYGNTTLIDPANYDNGGVLTPLLNNNRWQIQRINLFQSGLTRIQPGQHQYTSLEDAEATLKTETFTTETNIAENAIFRSYLIVKKNATNLSDVAQAKFIPVDKFGNVISGNTALTYLNIITALGYTPASIGQLDLKQNLKLHVPNAAYVTAPVNTILATLYYPANTLPHVLMLNSILLKTNVAPNPFTIRYMHNTVNSLVGATQIAMYNAAQTVRFAKFERTYAIEGGNLVGYGFTLNALTDALANASSTSSLAINEAVDNYFFLVVQSDGAVDTFKGLLLKQT